jgi:hypothetical protein
MDLTTTIKVVNMLRLQVNNGRKEHVALRGRQGRMPCRLSHLLLQPAANGSSLLHTPAHTLPRQLGDPRYPLQFLDSLDIDRATSRLLMLEGGQRRRPMLWRHPLA